MRIACIVASVPDTVMRALSTQPVSSLDELDRPDLVLARQREADALAHPLVDVVVDPLVAVAEDHRPVAHPQVDVLVAVDVPDPPALAAIDVDRVLAPGAEVRVRAARHRLQRAPVQVALARRGSRAGGRSAAGSVVMAIEVDRSVLGGPCVAATVARWVGRGGTVARYGTRGPTSWHTRSGVVNAIFVRISPDVVRIRRAIGRCRSRTDRGMRPTAAYADRALMARADRSSARDQLLARDRRPDPRPTRRSRGALRGRRRDRRCRVHRPVDGDPPDRHRPVPAGRRRSRRTPSGSGRAVGTAASARRASTHGLANGDAPLPRRDRRGSSGEGIANLAGADRVHPDNGIDCDLEETGVLDRRRPAPPGRRSSGPGSTRPPRTARSSTSSIATRSRPRSTRRAGWPAPLPAAGTRRDARPGQARARAGPRRDRARRDDPRGHARSRRSERGRAASGSTTDGRRDGRRRPRGRRDVGLFGLAPPPGAAVRPGLRLRPRLRPPDARAARGDRLGRPPGHVRREQPVPLLPADGRRPDPVGRLRRDLPRGQRRRAGLDRRPATFEQLEAQFVATFPQLAGLRFPYRWGGAIDTTSAVHA